MKSTRSGKGGSKTGSAGGKTGSAGGKKSFGSSRTMTVRLKSARSRTPSSQRWLERQLNDPYVAAAKRELAATMARLREAIAGEVDEVAEGDIADDWQATLDRIDDLVSEECWDAVHKINEGAGR